MAWVKLDDSFSEHPKIRKVGPLGLALAVSALCYSNRNLTDGFIPESEAETEAFWVARKGGSDLIRKLVEARVWDAAKSGYQIHDYGEYQPTREQVEAEREQRTQLAIVGGKARAATASRAAGKFTSRDTSQKASRAAGDPLDLPLDQPHQPQHQPQTSPVPDPVPDPDTGDRDVGKRGGVE